MNGHAALPTGRTTFRVLGPLEVVDPSGRRIGIGGKPATLLAVLLLDRTWISVDALVDAVWAGRAVPPSAQRNLKTYVWQLRRALPAGPDGPRIESRPGAYRLDVGAGPVDADLATELAAQAKSLLAEGAASEAEGLIRQALSLWRGTPYDGLTGAGVDRLDELNRCLREDLADAHLAAGRATEAIAVLRALTDEEPLREVTWTRLMAALHRTGRRHDALAAYQRARTILVRELGMEPGPELAALHQEILCGSSTPATVRSDLPCGTPGFVGRSDELAAVMAAARASDAVPVVSIEGMPGIGKTALALEAAHALADAYPDGRLYLDLHTHTGRALSAPVALSKLIGAVGGAAPLSDTVDELAATWRSAVSGRRILVLLDDVANAEQIRSLLPGAAGSMVLVTSRGRLTGLARTASVALDVLPDEDARRLVPIEAVDALPWCAGHPAAIRLLADRLRDRPAWTAARMLTQLGDEGHRRRELAAVLALFDASYRALPRRARRLYRLLGTAPRFDVRRAAGLTGLPQEEVAELFGLLVDQHLVSEPGPGWFALHPLAREHARGLLTDETELERVQPGAAGRADLELVAPDDPRVA